MHFKGINYSKGKTKGSFQYLFSLEAWLFPENKGQYLCHEELFPSGGQHCHTRVYCWKGLCLLYLDTWALFRCTAGSKGSPQTLCQGAMRDGGSLEQGHRQQWRALQGSILTSQGLSHHPSEEGAASRHRGSPGYQAPPWGRRQAEARPGCGPLGGPGSAGPMAGQGRAGLWALGPGPAVALLGQGLMAPGADTGSWVLVPGTLKLCSLMMPMEV